MSNGYRSANILAVVKGNSNVRTRIAGFLLAGIAAVAIAAAPSHSYGQSHRHKAAARESGTPLPKQKPSENRKADSKQPASKQPAKLERPEFSAAEQAAAQIPDMPDARFWADSTADFERVLPPQEGPWLILSTGGEEGAYGAGFLKGWTESGTRPQFAAVTGVSTGALMAVYAFAGPKYDEELHTGYTTVTASDIFEVGATPESLTDTWPLGQLISKRVTPELLADVAAEYRKGRRLFVMTTNLDAGRTVVWDMGTIAAHGGESALKLFRQILLASASVPGVFPPVYIKVEANGRQFEEMHADGGVNGPLFFGPESYLLPGSPKRLPATSLYVIVNGRLTPDFYMPQRNTAAILGRSITLALKTGARLELVLAGAAARRAGIPFNLTYVDSGFEQVGRGLFDPAYMNALYDYGLSQARGENRFHPNAQAGGNPSPTASGGLSGESVPK
ncbi:MAG TPA: patatin-like phospholipase family protein [Xanthobacteraceae bacterium]|nr:patatin-like phospholipase family protein [Xanthobacteraceae bacterium]